VIAHLHPLEEGVPHDSAQYTFFPPIPHIFAIQKIFLFTLNLTRFRIKIVVTLPVKGKKIIILNKKNS